MNRKRPLGDLDTHKPGAAKRRAQGPRTRTDASVRPPLVDSTMSRRPPNFRDRDVRRALKAVKASGESVATITISKDGVITLSLGKPSEPSSNNPNPWDEAIERLTK
jgi:hypothetical protein